MNKFISTPSSNSYCSVPQCRSWKKRNPELSFFTFPNEGKGKVKKETKFGEEQIDLRKQWIILLKIGKPVTKNMKVCSLHFLNSDFIPAISAQRRRLKKNALPSVNLPKDSQEAIVQSSITERHLQNKRQANTVQEQNIILHTELQNSKDQDNNEAYTKTEIEAANMLLDLIDFKRKHANQISFRD